MHLQDLENSEPNFHENNINLNKKLDRQKCIKLNLQVNYISCNMKAKFNFLNIQMSSLHKQQ